MDGAAWTLPVAKILTADEIRKVLGVAKERSVRDYRFFGIAAATGLRLSEVLHLRCEDHMGRRKLRITRRKKKVLRPEVIGVSPDVESLIEGAKGGRKDGWLFEGGAKPCIIIRRPSFLETVCPDCQRQIVDLSIFKKVGDRKRAFFTHLIQDHKRDADDISLWIGYMSESVTQKVCDGGHTSKRELQRRWSVTLELAGLKMEGRGIHSTRHAFAINLYAQTKNLKSVQTALGHSSPEISARYASVVDLDEQISSMESLLK